MFVAHKKLQAGKEAVSERVAGKKAKPAAQVKQISFIKAQLTKQASETSATLNERVLEEGPMSFFDSESNEESDESIVSKLVSIVRYVVYAFIGAPQMSNS